MGKGKRDLMAQNKKVKFLMSLGIIKVELTTDLTQKNTFVNPNE